MASNARTVSETWNSPDADIILVYKESVATPPRSIPARTSLQLTLRYSNHSYAVHKSNLSRSSVFRGMFEFPQEQRIEANVDGADASEPERARKRLRMTSEEKKLPEVAMDEDRAILDIVIPYFYVENEFDCDTDNLPQFRVGYDLERLATIARFFDKFELMSGKAALVVNLPYVPLTRRRGHLGSPMVDAALNSRIWSTTAVRGLRTTLSSAPP